MTRGVTVRMTSGLGNQLFQLSCGLHLAKMWGAQLSVDTTWFQLVARKHRPLRRYRLGSLQVESREKYAGARRLAIGLLAAVVKGPGAKLRLLEYLGETRVLIEEKPFTTQSFDAAQDCSQVYLDGYWQTAAAFTAAREEILRAARPKAELSLGARGWLEKIQGQRTCFIHIRRGDYATLVGEAGLLPLDYYHGAVRTMSNLAGNDMHWLVFAEDEAWVRQHMTFLPRWQLVAYESPDRDIEDLQLMAACSAGIIANSSYSWWGAALGDRPDRPIVAPATYWNRPETGLEEWALPGWQRIKGWD